MDDYIDPSIFGSDERLRHRAAGAPVPKTLCCCAAWGATPTTSAWSVRSTRSWCAAARPWDDPTPSTPRRRAAMPRRSSPSTRPPIWRPAGSARSPRDRSMKNRDGTPMLRPTRPCARHRQGSLCRRSGRGGHRGDRRRSQGCRRKLRSRSTSSRCQRSPSRGKRRRRTLKASMTTCPANVGLDFHYGDTDKVAAAFAGAAHVARLDHRAATASSSTRCLGRARRSGNTMPSCGTGRSMSAVRACSRSATSTSPACSASGVTRCGS